MRKQLRRWTPLLTGLLIVVLGVVAMVESQRVVQVLPVLLGGALLLYGIWEAYTGFCCKNTALRETGDDTDKPVLPALPRLWQGILNIIVAMVLILNRSVSVAFLGIALGMWAFFSGVLSLCMAWSVRRTYGFPAFFDGALKVIIGCAMMLRPFGGMSAWVAVMGLFFVLTGISVIISTFYWNRME